MNPSWTFTRDHVSRYAFWENGFTDLELDSFIDTIKTKNNLRSATTVNKDSEIVDESYRKSNITFINPDADTEWMYRRLTDIVLKLNEQFFQFDLHGFTEGLQFTEYTAPAGQYKSHVDKIYDSYTVRKLSIVLQLSKPEDYEGGDFEFIDSDNREKLSRARGTVLVFPSYSLHAVTPVTKGTRHSLVGWISGPPFK